MLLNLSLRRRRNVAREIVTAFNHGEREITFSNPKTIRAFHREQGIQTKLHRLDERVLAYSGYKSLSSYSYESGIITVKRID